MTRSCCLFAASTAIALATAGVAHAQVVLADTQADFSTTNGQGYRGFQYGVYTAPDVTSGTFSTQNFVPAGTAPNDYWYGGDSFNTPALWAVGQHPAFSTLFPAVRRYTLAMNGEPNYSGLVRIQGSFFDLDPGGDTSGFVTVNGVNVFNAPVPNGGPPGPPVPFDLLVAVTPGSTIDFGVTANGSAPGDSTGITATITTAVPEPCSLILTAIGGLAAAFGRHGRWQLQRWLLA